MSRLAFLHVVFESRLPLDLHLIHGSSLMINVPPPPPTQRPHKKTTHQATSSSIIGPSQPLRAVRALAALQRLHQRLGSIQ